MEEKYLSFKQFMALRGFTQVVRVVRENSNNYPYLTFVDANNQAENVYFSKNAATKVAKGLELDSKFFLPFTFIQVENAEKELRWKISLASELRAEIDFFE